MERLSESPLFVDSSLGTHLAISISPDDTVGNVRSKLRREHLLCFPDLGEIRVLALMVNRGSSFYHLPDSIPIKVAFMGLKRAWFLHMDATRIGIMDRETEIGGGNVYGATADKCINFNCKSGPETNAISKDQKTFSESCSGFSVRNISTTSAVSRSEILHINASNQVWPAPEKEPGTQNLKLTKLVNDIEHVIDFSKFDKTHCMDGDQEKREKKKEGGVMDITNVALVCKRKPTIVSCRKCYTPFRNLTKETLLHISSAKKRKKWKLKNQHSSRKCVRRTSNSAKVGPHVSNNRHVQKMTTNSASSHHNKRRVSATEQEFPAKHRDVYILASSTQSKLIHHQNEGNFNDEVGCTVSCKGGNDSLGRGKCCSSDVYIRYLEQCTSLLPSCNLDSQEEEKNNVHGVYDQTRFDEEQRNNLEHHNSRKVSCHAYIPGNLYSKNDLERECLSTETPHESMSEMVSVSGIIRRYFDSDEVNLTDNQSESHTFANQCTENHTFRYAHLGNQADSCWKREIIGVQEDKYTREEIYPLQSEASSHFDDQSYQFDKNRESSLQQLEQEDTEPAKIQDKLKKGLRCSKSHEVSCTSKTDNSKLPVKNRTKRNKKKKRDEGNKVEGRVCDPQKMQVEGQMLVENKISQPTNEGTSLGAKVDFALESAVVAAFITELPELIWSDNGQSSQKVRPRRFEVGKRILTAVGSLSSSFRKKSSNLQSSAMLSKVSGSKLKSTFRKLDFEILEDGCKDV